MKIAGLDRVIDLPLESVATVTVHVLPALWGAVVTEEHETGVVALRNTSEQIEGGIVVEQEVSWVASLRTDDIGALDGVTAEEDWLNKLSALVLFVTFGKPTHEVQANNVVVALLGVELDGETSWVTSLIGELTTEGDGRETNEDRGLLADRGQEVCFLFWLTVSTSAGEGEGRWMMRARGRSSKRAEDKSARHTR